MPSITIYTKGWCPYCAAAKDLLAKRGAAFTEIDIEVRPALRADMVQKAGGRTTVPQVFIGDAHVGGYDDLAALESRGGLDTMLKA